MNNVIVRVPTHLEKPGIWLRNIPCMGSSWNLKKKDIFMEKSWNFASAILSFVLYQKKLQNLVIVTCVYFLA